MTLQRRNGFRLMTVLAPAALFGGCATPAPSWDAIAARTPAAVVTATAETAAVSTANADAADDPAIWRNPANPAASLIVGTDKRAGLHVYALDGSERHFVDAGRVNNVDLIEAQVAGRPAVLVAASDRNDPAAARIALFTLDTAAGRLTSIGTVSAGSGEAYGICMASGAAGPEAFLVTKEGAIRQVALDLTGASPSARILREMTLPTQSEGCVVDPRTRRLYVAEEDAGIWRFDAAAGGATAGTRIAAVDGTSLVADVEGLALAPVGDRDGWLIASSQGDNAYVLIDLASEKVAGRFRIGAGRFGATSETDGIAVALGDFGPAYPGGLFVAQDGDNSPAAQNFKLVPWDPIRRAATGR